MEEVASLEGAVKDYGPKRIGPITFSVTGGDIMGFLGPNGSGKSTTIRMLLGLIRPSSGRVRLMQMDPLRDHARALAGVGYSPELPNLQSFLTPRELLHLMAKVIGLRGREAESDAFRLLERVGLTEYADYRIAKLSKGMIQRLSIAQAMVGSPRFLILDEPTIGIDPGGVVHFRSVFRDFAKEGGTVIMSSHILSEVESLCTSLAVIHSGRLLFRGGIEEFIMKGLGTRSITIQAENVGSGLVSALSEMKGVTRVTMNATGFVVETAKGSDPRAEISKLVVESGARLLSMGYSRNELHEAYVNLVRGMAE
ncbi:MAG TPA: ABC transporter ATP-binding protein [Nitrososphaerales archaeon]|nr:ABC transporter ATP-binding protein [Nitrososphaerales archaeon]